MSAFAPEMDRLKVTEKVLVRDGKRLIRQDLKASQAAAEPPKEPEVIESIRPGLATSSCLIYFAWEFNRDVQMLVCIMLSKTEAWYPGALLCCFTC